MSFSRLKTSLASIANGLRILLKEDHACRCYPRTTGCMWDQWTNPPRQAGMSHVIEHMVFKGTERYRPADIFVGGNTGRGDECGNLQRIHPYYVDVPVAGGQKAVNLLGELLHPAVQIPRVGS